LEDFYTRVRVPVDALQALAQSGAFECFGSRRDCLWQLGVLETKQPIRFESMVQNQLLVTPTIGAADMAMLEELDETEITAWNLKQTRTSLETHPMTLLRKQLEALGVRRLDRIYDGMQCTIAGLVIARQHPETAKGIVFLFLEDESGHCQGIIRAEIWAALRPVLRSRALMLTGRIQRLRGWKTMVVESAVLLEALVAREGEMAYFVR
jgi:error-prone DNA polymerase